MKKKLVIVLAFLFVLSCTASVLGYTQHKKNANTPKEEEKKDLIKYEYYLENELVSEMPTKNQTADTDETTENNDSTTNTYSFSSFQCSNSLTGNFDTETWTFTPDRTDIESTCKFYFVKNNYDVTITATNGIVDENNPTTVERESDGQFKITPNEGYEFDTVSCSNNKAATYDVSTSTLSINVIMEDTACKVDFKIKNLKMDLTVKNGKGNTTETADYGESVSAVIQANEGFEKPKAECTNKQTATIENNKLTIAKLTDNTTCTVTYSKTAPTTYTLAIKNIPSEVRITSGNAEQTINAGKDGKFSIKPDTGYEVKIDCGGVKPSSEQTDSEGIITYTFLNVNNNISCNITATATASATTNE